MDELKLIPCGESYDPAFSTTTASSTQVEGTNTPSAAIVANGLASLGATDQKPSSSTENTKEKPRDVAIRQPAMSKEWLERFERLLAKHGGPSRADVPRSERAKKFGLSG